MRVMIYVSTVARVADQVPSIDVNMTYASSCTWCSKVQQHHKEPIHTTD